MVKLRDQHIASSCLHACAQITHRHAHRHTHKHIPHARHGRVRRRRCFSYQAACGVVQGGSPCSCQAESCVNPSQRHAHARARAHTHTHTHAHTPLAHRPLACARRYRRHHHGLLVLTFLEINIDIRALSYNTQARLLWRRTRAVTGANNTTVFAAMPRCAIHGHAALSAQVGRAIAVCEFMQKIGVHARRRAQTCTHFCARCL